MSWVTEATVLQQHKFDQNYTWLPLIDSYTVHIDYLIYHTANEKRSDDVNSIGYRA